MDTALLFDTHCHLDDARFDEDRDQLIGGFQQAGIFACLSCGSDIKSSKASLSLAQQHRPVYAAVGIHPHEAAKAEAADLNQIAQMLTEDKVVALGEIGLDHHYDFSPRPVQAQWLEKQLDMAYELKKPVVLHVRDAHGAMIDLLRARRKALPRGVMHCFTGSSESAEIYQDLGFHISFAGPITFKNASKLLLSAQSIRKERLLIETDSPYLAPVPFRGKRNHPALVSLVCQKLAEIHGMGNEEMARLTRQNACDLFGIALE